jgi:putative RNA 2'-phosphotransferase
MKLRHSDVRLSKRLSYALRHAPLEFGLELSSGGWVEVGSLLSAFARRGYAAGAEELRRVVESNEKQRFELSADGTRIRARQGHSVPVDLGYAPASPPVELFHGTARSFVPAIRREGLLKGQRHDVHLSDSQETAWIIGARHGKPVVLRVRARELAASGALFYRTDNGVWLTERVPSEFIDFAE